MAKTAVKPSDVLDHAATLIEYWGWARRTFLTPKGCMCLEGAIGAASGLHIHKETPQGWVYCMFDGTMERLNDKSSAYVREVLRGRGVALVSNIGWNDDICKSEKEVIEVLRSAANLARSKGD